MGRLTKNPLPDKQGCRAGLGIYLTIGKLLKLIFLFLVGVGWLATALPTYATLRKEVNPKLR